jgi:hypothetical protein
MKKDLLMLGSEEDTKQVLAALKSENVSEVCTCGCHSGVPGRYHCFSTCCDKAGLIIKVQVHNG